MVAVEECVCRLSEIGERHQVSENQEAVKNT